MGNKKMEDNRNKTMKITANGECTMYVQSETGYVKRYVVTITNFRNE